MQENNMSVFGTVIRNEEIADFMRLLNLAREIFKQELTVVEIMPGGLTNKNFRAVTENGTQIAIRLAGQGTANYINRPGEKHNAGEIAGLGIAPEIYYYDPKTGSQIVEYIDAPTMHPVDFQTRDEVLVKAGAVMRRYHDSGLEFKTSFDPVAKIDEYKAILDEHRYGKRYEGWERMVEALERIRAAYAKQPPRRVPCHNDALAENFMLQGEQMRVIDWEYGGMNDGLRLRGEPPGRPMRGCVLPRLLRRRTQRGGQGPPADQQVPGDLPLVYLVAGSDLLRQGRGLLLGVRPYPCSPGLLLPGRPQLFPQPDPAGRLTGRRGSPWNSSERSLPIS